MARTRIHGQQVTDGSIELVDLSSALQSSISGKADAGNLAPVATSGSYNDLSDLPTLFSGAYADLSGRPTLFSGDYADLSNKPSLFDGNYSSLSGAPVLSTVATSGSYNDLSNLPTLFSGSYNDLTDKPTFSSDLDGLTDVAITSPSANQVLKYNGTAWVNAAAPATFSGSYNDLTNKPTLASFTTLTSPASGEFLKYNGTAWVNSALPTASQGASGIVTSSAQYFGGVKTFVGEGGGAGSGPAAEIRLAAANFMTWAQSYISLSNSSGSLMIQPSTDVAPITLYQQDGWGFYRLSFTRSPSFTANESRWDINTATTIDGRGTPAVNIPHVLTVGLSGAFGAKFQVNTGAAATKGMIVRGHASQSANLFEAQNSAGTVLSSIDSGGTFSGTSLSILHTYLSPTTTGVNLNGVTSNNYIVGAGNARTLMVKTSGVNPAIETTDGTNSLFASSIYGASVANVSGMSWAVGLVVNNSSSASTNIMKLQSVDVDKFVVDKTGTITTGIVPVARVTGLHAVATSGSYNDLSDKPSIPSIAGLATETYVDNAVAAVVNSAPAVLDTLNELAAALDDDPNFATTMTTALASKADTSSLADVATSGSYVDLSNKPTIYTPVKEVFTSLVDGVETVFVLADAPAVAGTEQVFVNGILQSSGAGDDYTISGDTITFNTAPEAGWKLIVYYFV